MTPTSRAEPALPIAADALLALDRAHMAQELLRGIAHDLRNHLQVIALGAALGDTDVDGRVEQAIDEMGDLLQLLGQLGRHDPTEPATSELAATLRLIERMAGYQRNAPSLPLQTRAPAERGELAMPASALAHALLNLIRNAKEASAATESAVRMIATPRAGLVEIAIEDQGPGLPADAGQPFRSTRPAATHPGLGLFAARTLLERFGGQLRLEPRPGGGTRAVAVVRAAGPAAAPNDRG